MISLWTILVCESSCRYCSPRAIPRIIWNLVLQFRNLSLSPALEIFWNLLLCPAKINKSSEYSFLKCWGFGFLFSFNERTKKKNRRGKNWDHKSISPSSYSSCIHRQAAAETHLSNIRGDEQGSCAGCLLPFSLQKEILTLLVGICQHTIFSQQPISRRLICPVKVGQHRFKTTLTTGPTKNREMKQLLKIVDEHQIPKCDLKFVNVCACECTCTSKTSGAGIIIIYH